MFLFLHGRIQHLFSILLAHLLFVLLLFLLVLLVLFIFLVLLVLLLFLVLLVLLVLLIFVLLILLVLLLLLLLTLAEFQVIARLVVGGVVAQCLLISLDGLAKHLVLLADYPHVMVSLGPTHGIGLQFGPSLQLLEGQRVLALHHQCIAKVVVGLRIASILLHRLAVGHLRIRRIPLSIHLVAIAHQAAIRLCRSLTERQHQEQQCHRA